MKLAVLTNIGFNRELVYNTFRLRVWPKWEMIGWEETSEKEELHTVFRLFTGTGTVHLKSIATNMISIYTW